MSDKLMQCGHVATSKVDGKDCCSICYPSEKSYTLEDKEADLTGRKSKCSDCGSLTDSKYTLPFFKHRPERELDSHYDGCKGWN